MEAGKMNFWAVRDCVIHCRDVLNNVDDVGLYYNIWNDEVHGLDKFECVISSEKTDYLVGVLYYDGKPNRVIVLSKWRGVRYRQLVTNTTELEAAIFRAIGRTDESEI